jgi:hypothetical protein
VRAYRRLLMALAACGIVAALHLALVRVAVQENVAHLVLGAGNAAPPLAACALAVALVIVRLAALVIVPGALCAIAVTAVAHVLSRYSSISSGAGISSGGGAGETRGGRSRA